MAGFQTANAAYIGNAALNEMDIYGVKLCLEAGWQGSDQCSLETLCYEPSEDEMAFSGTFDSSVADSSNFHKLVAIFSGQIPHSSNAYDFANGAFLSTQLQYHCYDDRTTPMYCWRCSGGDGSITQYSGKFANWYSWGSGMNLNIRGTDNELDWYTGTCNSDAGNTIRLYLFSKIFIFLFPFRSLGELLHRSDV